jgi:uncharacterized membrane protein HdeD (DUF308 family)
MNQDANRAIAQGAVIVTTWGVLLVVIGVGMIVAPLVIPLRFATLLAWLFLGSGVIRIVQAFQSIDQIGFLPRLSAGLLYVLFAIFLFIQLIDTTLPLTPVLGGTLILEGGLEIVLAFQLRPQSGWSWVLLSGFVSMVLGILISARAGQGAIWLLGILVGTSIILTGLWFIMLSLGIRSSSRQTD